MRRKMTGIQYSTLFFLLISACRERQTEGHTKLPPCDFLKRSHGRKGRNGDQNGAMFASWIEREEYMRGGLVLYPRSLRSLPKMDGWTIY